MNQYLLLIFSIGALIISISILVDFRAGRRQVFQKTKVKENSFLRKVFHFNDSENNPLLYAKIIPVLIQAILFLFVIAFYIVYWINPESVEPFFNRWEYYFVSTMVLLPELIYSGILMI